MLSGPFVFWSVMAMSAQTSRQALEDAVRTDVHGASGVTCADCHAEQRTETAPSRTDIARLCARCHSDPAYMRKFDPQVRVDQFAQYLTSVHGEQMHKGETRVATCSDCHGAHGITRVRDSRSPVAPANVAQTCARCHGDATRMGAFGRNETPVADWSASVHATALLKRGDTSAPTCSTCHGSHGARPPGVTEIANVCSQCHVREADLFRASPKKSIFESIGQAECLVCHGNHRIEHPADGWISIKSDAVCAQCHDEQVKGAATINTVHQGLEGLSAAVASADGALSRAERAGMLVDDGRFSLREARQHLINARVTVHAFAEAPFTAVVNPGVAAAKRAEQTANQALEELQYRRRGLTTALVVIMGFLAALWLKIRSLPAPD
jgi:predicted CXXCH cytochrome family protein